MRKLSVVSMLVFSACAPPAVMPGPTDDADAVVFDLTMAPLPDLLSPGCLPACSGGTHFCNASQHCVACLADTDCPAGNVCKVLSPVQSACVMGCNDDARCKANGGAAMACCGMACADTGSDLSNCGACGKACSASHGKAVCSGGKCSLGSCDPGWGDCNMDPADGCEANLHVDTKNCNACAKACTSLNGIAGCSDGCYLAACNYGYDDCDGDPKNGCEASIISDAKNCGRCANPCVGEPHAQTTCVVGACTLSCSNGYADCDGKYETGCETAVATDVNNCGACGTVCKNVQVCIAGVCTCPPCSFPNAMAICLNDLCAIGQCLQGFGDCDKNPANGCETKTATDASNCGACGNVCPMGLVCQNGGCTCPQCNIPNAKSKCINNVCMLDTCLAGFADCDLIAANGCEVNLNSDANNCTACGKVCPVNQACSLGVCSTCSNTLIDNGGTLCIPAGKTYALSGDHCYTTQVIIKGTLTVTPFDGNNNGSLIIRAPSILISAGGAVLGDAAGSLGGTVAANNGGNGGGGAGGGCGGGPGSCVAQGGSGGGYGGVGGTAKPYSNVGVCEKCSQATTAHCWGTAGIVSGTDTGADVDLGSGGGASGNSCGCNNAGARGGIGGASVLLLAKSMQIDGTVSSNGETPPVDIGGCGYHPGGGGGSGGAVVLRAETLSGTGSLSANAGNGAASSGMGNDWGWAGGGGGGGRVKIFATTDSFKGTLSAANGVGGATCGGGQCTVGLPGSAGSTNRSTTIPNTWKLINCGGL